MEIVEQDMFLFAYVKIIPCSFCPCLVFSKC